LGQYIGTETSERGDGINEGRDGGVMKGYLIELVEFTDPYCTWCWGSEPILRKIEEAYGEQVKIGYVMGGLVKDIREFYDPLNRIGGKDWSKQAARHWLEASEAHGMPVDERVFYDIETDFWSTYPANIAVKAAEFQGTEKAAKFLRRLREAAAAERKQIHREDVQAALAGEVGLDPDRLLLDMRSGKAQEAFGHDLEVCRRYGVTGFPTFLLRNREGGNERLLRGYHPFKSFEEAFVGMSPGIEGRVQELSDANILRFIKTHGKVATMEVAVLFDVDKGRARHHLSRLEKAGKAHKVRAGNDYFWMPGRGLQAVREDS
jgi:protein-disulfide isomerase-like protein with CxxC motif